MSTPANPAAAPSASISVRLRNIVFGIFFGIVLLLPQILQIRRNPSSWLAFRVFMGLVGAALVVLPIGLWNSYLLAIGGLALFITSILLPPAKLINSADEKAKELGALIVVNGGRFQPSNEHATSVQLFVGAEQLWVLNSKFRPLLAIPVAEISSATVEQVRHRSVLRVLWNDHAAEFTYRGMFAAHLARVAETTLQSVMRPALPVIPQRRAASA
jgi:hypothetical protein